MNKKAFLELLSRQLVQNNEVRQHAEQEYMKLVKDHVSSVIQYHFLIIYSKTTKTLKSLSLIHLQHIYEHLDDIEFQKIHQDVHDFVIKNLVGFFEILEFQNDQMENVSFVVARIASVYMDFGAFSHFPDLLFSLSKNNVSTMFSAYINCLSQCIKLINHEKIQLNFDEAINVVQSSLISNENPSLSVSSLRLLYSIAEMRGVCDEILVFAPFISQLLQTVPETVLFQMICDLNLFVVIQPNFFLYSLESIYNSLLMIASNTEYLEANRLRSIDTTIRLLRKMPDESIDFLSDIISVLLQIGTEIDDCTYDDETNQSLSTFTLNQIAYIAAITSIQDKFFPIITEFISSLLDDGSWQCFYTAIYILGVSFCSDNSYLMGNIDQVIFLLLKSLNHDHPFCRIVSYTSLSQISEKAKQIVYESYHDQIVNSYLESISREDSFLVLSKAFLSLSAYIYTCPPTKVKESYENILMFLMDYLSIENSDIQSSVLRCINVFAHTAKKLMSQFYPTMISWAQEILCRQLPPEYISVRSRAIEMVSHAGYCVESNLFENDSVFFLNMFLEWDWESLPSCEFEQLMLFLFTIAKLVPKVFLKETDSIFQRLLTIATKEPAAIIHKPFSTAIQHSKDRVPLLYSRSILVEIYTDDLSSLASSMWAIDQVFSILYQESEMTSFHRQIKKICGKRCLNHYHAPLAISALHCLSVFGEIYSKYPDQLTLFNIKFLRTLLKVLSDTRDSSLSYHALTHIRNTLKSQISLNAITDSQISEIILSMYSFDIDYPKRCENEHSKTEFGLIRSEIDFAMASVFHFLFMSFNDILVSFLSKNLNDWLPIDIEEPRVLSISLWTDYIIACQLFEERVFSDLIQFVLNSIGNNNVYIVETSYLCLSRIIRTGELDEETNRDNAAIILSSMDSFNTPESKSSYDAGIIALSSLLESGCELPDRNQCINSFVNRMPLTTDFPETNQTIKTFVDLLEVISIDDNVFQKMIQTAIFINLWIVIEPSVKQKLYAIIQYCIESNPLASVLYNNLDRETREELDSILTIN